MLVALDDSINPKTGKKIFACQHHFDHAAKHNQRRYPWSQKIVSIGLLKSIKGRWCCLPLAFEFYFMKKHLQAKAVTKGKKPIEFRTKFEQATEMFARLASVFPCGAGVGGDRQLVWQQRIAQAAATNPGRARPRVDSATRQQHALRAARGR